jgi:coenzyme F420-reducing hydrogenase delta subunit
MTSILVKRAIVLRVYIDKCTKKIEKSIVSALKNGAGAGCRVLVAGCRIVPST